MIIDLYQEYLKCETLISLENLREGICHFNLGDNGDILIEVINKEIEIMRTINTNIVNSDYTYELSKDLKDLKSLLFILFSEKDKPNQ